MLVRPKIPSAPQSGYVMSRSMAIPAAWELRPFPGRIFLFWGQIVSGI